MYAFYKWDYIVLLGELKEDLNRGWKWVLETHDFHLSRSKM